MIAEDAKTEIEARLSRAEAGAAAKILFAVESGSRAWGFPSPDSDYDARFVYVRPVDWYLSIRQRRDVIEQRIDGLYDVNGWDLAKALRLLVKPNPVLLEWLQSPHFYRRSETAIAALSELAEATAHQQPCRHHYAGLARRQYASAIDGAEAVKLKKYFYAVRPALALRWLRMNPDQIPPMRLDALLAGTEPPTEAAQVLAELVARKAETREMGLGPRIPALDALVVSELEAAADAVAEPRAAPADLLERADDLFRWLLEAYAPIR